MAFVTTRVGFGKPLPAAQGVEALAQVFRWLAVPAKRLSGRGVHESEGSGVEHEPRRRRERSRVVADVHALAEERVSCFGEVDTDLVRTPGLESARNEAHAAEAFDDLDVCHGMLLRPPRRVSAASLVFRAPPKAIATVFDEVTLVGCLSWFSVDERDVAPLDGVGTELSG